MSWTCLRIESVMRTVLKVVGPVGWVGLVLDEEVFGAILLAAAGVGAELRI